MRVPGYTHATCTQSRTRAVAVEGDARAKRPPRPRHMPVAAATPADPFPGVSGSTSRSPYLQHSTASKGQWGEVGRYGGGGLTFGRARGTAPATLPKRHVPPRLAPVAAGVTVVPLPARTRLSARTRQARRRAASSQRARLPCLSEVGRSTWEQPLSPRSLPHMRTRGRRRCRNHGPGSPALRRCRPTEAARARARLWTR